MPAIPPELANCPHCGAPNPVTAELCKYCGGRIAALRPEAPLIGPPQRDDFQLVTSEEPSSPIGIVLLIFGILLIIVGIVLLAMAPSVHQSVQSFNNACSQNPNCQPQSDPSGGMTGGGAAAIVVGIILAAVGAYLRAQ